MTSILTRLNQALDKLRTERKDLETPEFLEAFGRVRDQLNAIEDSASGSWIGYHATTYVDGFRKRAASDFFDREWGLVALFNQGSTGSWRTYSYAEVIQEINRRCATDIDLLRQTSEKAQKLFVETKAQVIPALDVLTSLRPDDTIARVRGEIDQLKPCETAQKFVLAITPKQFVSRDQRAVSEGIIVPPHIKAKATVLEHKSIDLQIAEFERLLTYIITYMEMREETVMSPTTNRTKIFIGHGGSKAWRDLNDFLERRLKLTPDEFNREPVAGVATKERLEQMLADARFAFIVMTAEDIHDDDKYHARENVIHEVGLFQGRLGFKRAIVLLEEGCTEFSNIEGLGQIRFPKGNIMAKSEEIRSTLEREGIL